MVEEAHQTFATDGGNLWDIFGQIFVKLKMGKPWAAWAWWKKTEEGDAGERGGSGQTNLFAAGAAVPFRPVRRVRRQCQRAAGAVAARGRGVVRFGSPDPDPRALLPYNSISPPSNTTRPTNSREY